MAANARRQECAIYRVYGQERRAESLGASSRYAAREERKILFGLSPV